MYLPGSLSESRFKQTKFIITTYLRTRLAHSECPAWTPGASLSAHLGIRDYLLRISASYLITCNPYGRSLALQYSVLKRECNHSGANLDGELRRTIRHEQIEVGIDDIEAFVIPTVRHPCPGATSHTTRTASLENLLSPSALDIYPLLISKQPQLPEP